MFVYYGVNGQSTKQTVISLCLIIASGVYGRNICYGDGGDPGGAGRAAVLLPQEALQEARQATAAATAGKQASKLSKTNIIIHNILFSFRSKVLYVN